MKNKGVPKKQVYQISDKLVKFDLWRLPKNLGNTHTHTHTFSDYSSTEVENIP